MILKKLIKRSFKRKTNINLKMLKSNQIAIKTIRKTKTISLLNKMKNKNSNDY